MTTSKKAKKKLDSDLLLILDRTQRALVSLRRNKEDQTAEDISMLDKALSIYLDTMPGHHPVGER